MTRSELASGRGLAFETRGTGDTIVLLHPVGLDHAFWTPIADRLSTRYHVVAVDLPAHGESDKCSGPLTLDRMAQDVGEMLAIHIDAPAVLVGCSLGAMVAQGLALHVPSRVRGLVLLNASGTLSKEGRNMMRGRAETSARGMSNVADVTIDRWFSPGFRAAQPAAVEKTREHLLRLDPAVHAEVWLAISELDYAPRLNAVSVPVLVGTGSADLSTPPAVAKGLKDAFGKADYREADGAGHLMPLEQPAVVAGWIEDFMATLQPAPLAAGDKTEGG